MYFSYILRTIRQPFHYETLLWYKNEPRIFFYSYRTIKPTNLIKKEKKGAFIVECWLSIKGLDS